VLNRKKVTTYWGTTHCYRKEERWREKNKERGSVLNHTNQRRESRNQERIRRRDTKKRISNNLSWGGKQGEKKDRNEAKDDHGAEKKKVSSGLLIGI